MLFILIILEMLLQILKNHFLRKLVKEENLKYQQETINSVKYIHHTQILLTLTLLKIKEVMKEKP